MTIRYISEEILFKTPFYSTILVGIFQGPLFFWTHSKSITPLVKKFSHDATHQKGGLCRKEQN